jgi:hypothetical protein
MNFLTEIVFAFRLVKGVGQKTRTIKVEKQEWSSKEPKSTPMRGKRKQLY